ncbi:MAG: hypothetical protein JST82_04110 [Bacteroidetes bacterium]|nr:hypothetical protein [Bacteroidota bacterium]
MNYIFKGSLRGLLCSDCFMHLSHIKVRLYQTQKGQDVVALTAANPAQTFHQLSDKELKSKEKLLIAETTTDAEGNFIFDLSEKQKYEGGAFDVDIVLDNSFGKKKQPHERKELQFHITTLQPMWKERIENDRRILVYYWYWEIIAKWWCRILQLLDLWVICGRVVDCETGKPIVGVKVSAFDVDWLQDDPLGIGWTDNNGYFKIYYTSADFETTLLSPWLNIEWPAGPDIYFKIESSSGTVLLAEDRQTGHRADRTNRGNCFCVKLCVKDGPTGDISTTPWFIRIGNYNITNDIDAMTGLTTHNRSFATGIGFGFFGGVKLVGYATKKVPTAPGSPLYYRFRYSTDGATWNNVTNAQAVQARLVVGGRVVNWGPGTAFQDVVIDPNQPASVPDALPVFDPMNPSTPPADHVLHMDANGWVRVDQSVAAIDNGFYGPLAWLDTNTIVPGGNPLSGIAYNAGDPIPAAAQKTGHIMHIAFQTTDNPVTHTNPGDPNFNEQVQQAHIYVNNWSEINMLKLEELYSGGSAGCNPVSAHAHVDYTADHELIAAWNLGVSSNALPGGITINHAGVSGTTPRGNNDKFDLANPGEVTPAFPGGWPSCAYSMVLSTRRKLTNGENNDDTHPNQIIFCR